MGGNVARGGDLDSADVTPARARCRLFGPYFSFPLINLRVL